MDELLNCPSCGQEQKSKTLINGCCSYCYFKIEPNRNDHIRQSSIDAQSEKTYDFPDERCRLFFKSGSDDLILHIRYQRHLLSSLFFTCLALFFILMIHIQSATSLIVNCDKVEQTCKLTHYFMRLDWKSNQSLNFEQMNKVSLKYVSGGMGRGSFPSYYLLQLSGNEPMKLFDFYSKKRAEDFQQRIKDFIHENTAAGKQGDRLELIAQKSVLEKGSILFFLFGPAILLLSFAIMALFGIGNNKRALFNRSSQLFTFREEIFGLPIINNHHFKTIGDIRIENVGRHLNEEQLKKYPMVGEEIVLYLKDFSRDYALTPRVKPEESELIRAIYVDIQDWFNMF